MTEFDDCWDQRMEEIEIYDFRFRTVGWLASLMEKLLSLIALHLAGTS
jgi:hypothetical protein